MMNQRRALVWMPRGPGGIALFVLLLALGIAAAVALSIVLLAVLAVGVVGLGVYGVGRTLATGNGPNAIGPGLWELLIAAQELERYLDGLAGFPRSRVLREQIAELETLRQRGAALDRRRDTLLLRLRHTDLR
jgi:hypothetical protein